MSCSVIPQLVYMYSMKASMSLTSTVAMVTGVVAVEAWLSHAKYITTGVRWVGVYSARLSRASIASTPPTLLFIRVLVQ